MFASTRGHLSFGDDARPYCFAKVVWFCWVHLDVRGASTLYERHSFGAIFDALVDAIMAG